MIRSVFTRRLIAVLALLAWANVQAMACCLMETHGHGTETIKTQATATEASSMEAVATESPMAADHACCPKPDVASDAQTADSPETAHSAPAPDAPCGMNPQEATALCCTPSEAAKVSIPFSPHFSFAYAALITTYLPVFTERPPAADSPPSPLAPSGPPRFLTLERILI